MSEAYIVDALRTPFGRYAGVLASVRTDDLASLPIQALVQRNSTIDWDALDDVVYGCANQAGEDNRNVARMAALLAGLPVAVPGITVNRLCGSGMDALAWAARAIRCGEADLLIAGGVESMSRAPFVMAKAESAFSRKAQIHDTTLGWRFVNPRLQARYGTDSMPETAENVAEAFQITREDQDAFALRSQQRAKAALDSGRLAEEITPVCLSDAKSPPVRVSSDEPPRPDTTLEGLARLPTPFRTGGTVTAGNSSGINDGAGALLLASEAALARFRLTPAARVLGTAVAGIEPRLMGLGPVPASRKLLARCALRLADIDLVELNEAFAAQTLAVLRELGLPDDAEHVNPNGGAIALGHPLGASGTRLVASATYELRRRAARYALCTMCIGVGQGIATLIERI